MVSCVLPRKLEDLTDAPVGGAGRTRRFHAAAYHRPMTTPATPSEGQLPGHVTVFGPDFPFPYDQWLRHPLGLGTLPAAAHGATVAVVGAGLAGLVAAYELMELGLRPVVYESARVGGRLRSHAFEGADGIVAELGGMRFPLSGTAF